MSEREEQDAALIKAGVDLDDLELVAQHRAAEKRAELVAKIARLHDAANWALDARPGEWIPGTEPGDRHGKTTQADVDGAQRTLHALAARYANETAHIDLDHIRDYTRRAWVTRLGEGDRETVQMTIDRARRWDAAGRHAVAVGL
ncbi:hypothetical protein [Gryllotalpicola protaetiae]|uniref:Uncharacterized protein n=1 Tax=Gryllotalpicola protaetiae TaxID=2419771 RepID=A0A387BWP1_9MICO|nr:hypothetical protein [Gryllotalpicola protaetiae]AYG05536.1 hypothetical protein D7I44_17815 [Gryllotalpicola protaetiae]